MRFEEPKLKCQQDFRNMWSLAHREQDFSQTMSAAAVTSSLKHGSINKGRISLPKNGAEAGGTHLPKEKNRKRIRKDWFLRHQSRFPKQGRAAISLLGGGENHHGTQFTVTLECQQMAKILFSSAIPLGFAFQRHFSFCILRKETDSVA